MSPPDRQVVLHVPRAALWILGILLMAPWLVFLPMFWKANPSPAATATATGKASSPDGSAIIHCPTGPWGELEYSRILIEPPEEFIPTEGAGRSAPKWTFKGYDAGALAQLWNAAGLDAAQKSVLDDPARREVTPQAIVVNPPEDLVLGLSTLARTKLYSALSLFPENLLQNEPFRFRIDSPDEWFAASGLPEKTVALTKRLLYRRGNSLLFSDYELVEPLLESPSEHTRFLKTMARKTSLLLRLRVREGADIDALALYWSRGRRAKDVRPLLQSLARLSSGLTIDVAHLLPRLPRSLLYTYPLPSDNPTEHSRDCHWTSLNFFNEEPDERFADLDVVKRTLLTKYYPAPGEPKLGDILVFIKPDGVVVHSCVYIAADIVFTKNGASFSMPWMLMTLPDMIAFYPVETPLEIRRYRLKDL